ncbi:zinc finger protein 239-like [Physella acuta]|uniref:zinc finger protein 239-like n=1 Tax=Physella acuta TaxID=109671 RepID=UPI0027DC7517|nr:zinc finger protein 239-like [Physella acuta]XP_059168202.1 zinc finger protein 239-like [Physella acuta]
MESIRNMAEIELPMTSDVKLEPLESEETEEEWSDDEELSSCKVTFASVVDPEIPESSSYSHLSNKLGGYSFSSDVEQNNSLHEKKSVIDYSKLFKFGLHADDKSSISQGVSHNTSIDIAKEGPFKCDFCDKEFTHSVSLKVHLRKHAAEDPFLSKTSSVALPLEFPTNEKKEIEPKLILASIPASSSSFEMTEYRNMWKFLFPCDICSMKFTKHYKLVSHRRIHTGEKPYICGKCGKGFRENQYLKRHYRKHTGEKPYECKFCSMTFTHRSNFQVHERTHTGEKLYKCDICGMSFSQSCSLKLHLKRHTDEKSFA